MSAPQTCPWRLSFDGFSPDPSETSVECHSDGLRIEASQVYMIQLRWTQSSPRAPGDTTTGTCGEMARRSWCDSADVGFPGKGPVGVEVGTGGKAEQ